MSPRVELTRGPQTVIVEADKGTTKVVVEHAMRLWKMIDKDMPRIEAGGMGFVIERADPDPYIEDVSPAHGE